MLVMYLTLRSLLFHACDHIACCVFRDTRSGRGRTVLRISVSIELPIVMGLLRIELLIVRTLLPIELLIVMNFFPSVARNMMN